MYGLDSTDGLLSMTCYELITTYCEATPINVAWDKVVFGSADFSLAEQAAANLEAQQATEPAETTAATETTGAAE